MLEIWETNRPRLDLTLPSCLLLPLDVLCRRCSALLRLLLPPRRLQRAGATQRAAAGRCQPARLARARAQRPSCVPASDAERERRRERERERERETSVSRCRMPVMLVLPCGGWGSAPSDTDVRVSLLPCGERGLSSLGSGVPKPACRCTPPAAAAAPRSRPAVRSRGGA